MLGFILAMALTVLAGPVAAQTPIPAVPLGGWHRFVDADEGSFSIDVPAGWRISGGLARRNALQFSPWLAAVSPDGNTILAFGDPSLQSYILPNPMLAATGFGEGHLYNGGGGTVYMVSRYLPGLTFATLYGERQLPRFCTAIVMTSGGERPEAAARIGGGVSQTTAGEARFTCHKGGLEMSAYVFCATSLIPWGYGTGIWYPSYLFAHLAPKPLAAVAEQIVAHMLGSFVANPQWIARQSETAMAVSRIATAAGQSISDAIMRSWEAKNATIDRILEAHSRATLGIEVYTNPATGEHYTVPNTYNHVWINPQGNVVGTEADTPPGSAFVPLQRVPPGG